MTGGASPLQRVASRLASLQALVPGRESPLWVRDLAFFLLAALLIGVGTQASTGLTGLDESIHSFRSAIETYQHGRWWAPTLEGAPRVEKPPLLYWLMGFSFSAFGISFFSGRLPGVLMGAGLVLVVRLLARQLGYKNWPLVGWLALALFAVASESRRAMLDIPTALCTALAVYWTIQAWAREEPWRLYLAALAVAAGVMFKGPVILVFAGAAALAARFAPPLAAPMPALRCWPGPLLLAAVLASAWPLLALLGPGHAIAALSDDFGDRQFSAPGLQSIGQVLSAFLAVALPWSFLLLGAALVAVRRLRVPEDPQVRWLLLWLALALVPFFFIQTFERYLVPLIPVIVLLLASVLADSRTRVARFGLFIAVVLLAIPTTAFSAMAWRFEQDWLAPALALAALAATAVFALRAEPMRTAQAAALTLALLLGTVYPRLGVNELPAGFVPAMEGIEVQHYRRPYPGGVSIHLQRSVRVMVENEALPARLAAFDGVLVVLEDDWAHLQQQAHGAGVELEPIKPFRSFYARVTFVRFTRVGVGRDDWIEAFRSGDWEPLKPTFFLVRVRPRTIGQDSAMAHATVPPHPRLPFPH